MLRSQFYECVDCSFRFPVTIHDPQPQLCPACGVGTLEADAFYEGHPIPPLHLKGRRIQVLLDNLRSAYNVGSIFRTADGVQVEHIYLCGITPTPKNLKVGKTALGTEQVIPWSYHKNGVATAVDLQAQGHQLWAVEGGPRAESLWHMDVDDKDGRPVVLILGNEVAGVDPALLTQCERVVAIPMHGVKSSLNVTVAFGIVVYTLQAFVD